MKKKRRIHHKTKNKARKKTHILHMRILLPILFLVLIFGGSFFIRLNSSQISRTASVEKKSLQIGTFSSPPKKTAPTPTPTIPKNPTPTPTANKNSTCSWYPAPTITSACGANLSAISVSWHDVRPSLIQGTPDGDIGYLTIWLSDIDPPDGGYPLSGAAAAALMGSWKGVQKVYTLETSGHTTLGAMTQWGSASYTPPPPVLKKGTTYWIQITGGGTPYKCDFQTYAASFVYKGTCGN